MQQFEYRILSLRAEGVKEHVYAWHCSACGRLGDFDCIVDYLNRYGQDGWHVAAHVSDGRFGNTVILERPVAEAPEKEAVLVQSSPSPTPDSSGMLARSLDAYTAALEAQLSKRDQEFAVLLELLSTQLQGGFSQALHSVATRLDTPVSVQVRVDDREFQRSCAELVTALTPPPTPVRRNFLFQLARTVKDYFTVQHPQPVLESRLR